jgi:Na+-translocating ferredoxin:NAD+ oxidoreductase RnfA subunit
MQSYLLVMVIFAGLRARLALSEVPRLFAAPPIGCIVVTCCSETDVVSSPS